MKYRMDVLSALKEKGYNTGVLRREKIFGEATIQQIRTGQMISWDNMERLCELLNCQPGELIEMEQVLLFFSQKDLKTLFGCLESPIYRREICSQERPLRIVRQKIVGDTGCLPFTLKGAADLEYFRALTNSLPDEVPLQVALPPDVSEKEIYKAVKEIRRQQKEQDPCAE